MEEKIRNPDLDLLLSGDRAAILEFCKETHPASVAELLIPLEPEVAWHILHMLDVDDRAEVFSHIPLDQQVVLATGENRQAMARLLEEMAADERADLVQQLDEKVREDILPLVVKAEREDIRKLLSYAEGTAGSVMTTDYATVRPDMTIAAALDQLRRQAPSRETIYYIYVVDARQHLLGIVSLKDLILGRPGDQIEQIMNPDIIAVQVGDDQEHVAREIEKYDLIAIPVTDPTGALVGIITHDDAIDILRQEQQEDVERLMAIAGSHSTREYMTTSIWSHFRNRIVWILPLAVFGLISGMIIQENESMIQFLPLLAIFIPMLADTGGNTGSQSATLVVRALALQEIKPRDILRVLSREVRVAVLLALALSLVAFGRVMFFGTRAGDRDALPETVASQDLYLKSGDAWLPVSFSTSNFEKVDAGLDGDGFRVFRRDVAADGTESFLPVTDVDIPDHGRQLTLFYIGFTVSLALALQVVSSTLLGAFLPLTASLFKVDPALVASPALTTCVDISGVFIFFTVTGLMLSPFMV